MTDKILPDEALDILFRAARTHNAWQDRAVSDTMLRAIWELAKMGPTTANISPMRVLFVKSKEAKERLRPALSEGNLEKTMKAPAVAIIGYDLGFPDLVPRLFPHKPEAKSWFEGKPEHIQVSAFRNGSLQGAYFILAARALGLDCGPMSGFDNAKVDAEFFAGTQIKSNFLCNIGYGDAAGVFPRSPRLSFDEACKIL